MSLEIATVTSSSPLEVRRRFDSQDTPVQVNLAGMLFDGDEVILEKVDGRLTVLGIVGGGYGPWVPLNFQNGWTNFSLANYPAAASRTAPGGKVELRGMIGGGGANNLMAFLPEDHEPNTTWQYLPLTESANNTVCSLYVGNVTGGKGLVRARGDSTWVNLIGLYFYRG